MIPKSVQRFSEKIMLKQRIGDVARRGSLADRDQAGTGFRRKHDERAS
jgi:hypothetical protein